MERVADRDRPRRAAHGVGRVRAREAELDGDVAARGAGNHGQRERGMEPPRTLREEAPNLRSLLPTPLTRRPPQPPRLTCTTAATATRCRTRRQGRTRNSLAADRGTTKRTPAIHGL